MRTLTGLAAVLAIVGCGTVRVASPPAAGDYPGGEFVSPNGVIRIDPSALAISIDSTRYALTDCSTAELHCFKNEELGFHIVLPRSCQGPFDPGGEVRGGYRFFRIAAVEHGDVRQGRYVSALSDRFAYGYFLDSGLHEIRYDPSGRERFGPRSPGNSLSGAERQPFTYRLAAGRAFLRCR